MKLAQTQIQCDPFCWDTGLCCELISMSGAIEASPRMTSDSVEAHSDVQLQEQDEVVADEQHVVAHFASGAVYGTMKSVFMKLLAGGVATGVTCCNTGLAFTLVTKTVAVSLLSSPVGWVVTGTIAALYGVSAIRDSRLTVRARLAAGVGVQTLLSEGVSIAQLLEEGVELNTLLAENVSVGTLLAEGVEVRALLAENVSAGLLIAEEVSVATLLEAGAEVRMLLAEKVSVWDTPCRGSDGTNAAGRRCRHCNTPERGGGSCNIAPWIFGGNCKEYLCRSYDSCWVSCRHNCICRVYGAWKHGGGRSTSSQTSGTKNWSPPHRSCRDCWVWEFVSGVPLTVCGDKGTLVGIHSQCCLCHAGWSWTHHGNCWGTPCNGCGSGCCRSCSRSCDSDSRGCSRCRSCSSFRSYCGGSGSCSGCSRRSCSCLSDSSGVACILFHLGSSIQIWALNPFAASSLRGRCQDYLAAFQHVYKALHAARAGPAVQWMPWDTMSKAAYWCNIW